MSCHGAHIGECIDGWEPGDTIVQVLGEGKRREYPSVQPCPHCRPGQHAVWRTGLMRSDRDWTKDERAIRVYLKATVDAGADLPAEPPHPTALWSRLMREIAARGAA